MLPTCSRQCFSRSPSEKAVDRQPADRVCVEDREQHVVDADPEAEHEQRRDGEASIARQQPQGEPHIQRQGVDKRQPPLVAIGGRHLIDPSKRSARGDPGVRHRQSFREILLREQLQVCPHFFRESLVAPPP